MILYGFAYVPVWANGQFSAIPIKGLSPFSSTSTKGNFFSPMHLKKYRLKSKVNAFNCKIVLQGVANSFNMLSYIALYYTYLYREIVS